MLTQLISVDSSVEKTTGNCEQNSLPAPAEVLIDIFEKGAVHPFDKTSVAS